MANTISILGHTFRVEEVDDLLTDHGVYGRMHCIRRLIEIDAGLDYHDKTYTLWHEIMHAILGVSGISHLFSTLPGDCEEAVVIAMESGLLPLIIRPEAVSGCLTDS